MFRKYYKAANDDIKPNRELIDEIFKKAELDEKKSAKVYKFSRKYGMAVAAVLVFAAVALVYPQLDKMNETPQLVEKKLSLTADNSETNSNVTEENFDTHTENAPKTEKAAAPENAVTQPKIQEKEVKTEEKSVGDDAFVNASNSEKTAVPAEDKKAVADVSEKAVSGEESTEDGVAETVEFKAEQGFAIPDGEEPADGTASSGGGGGGSSSMARWSKEKAESKKIEVFDINSVTQEEAQKAAAFLWERFGKIDSETGNEHIFEIVGKTDINEERFYVGRWRWLVDGNHSSLLTEFVLNETFTEMYDFYYDEDGSLILNEEQNLIK